MKLLRPNRFSNFGQPRSRKHQSGVAVIVILAFLAIMFLCIAANARAVHELRQEVALAEQRQIRRLAGGNPTNAPPSIQVNPTNTAPLHPSNL